MRQYFTYLSLGFLLAFLFMLVILISGTAIHDLYTWLH
jgi:hypothetical protein